MLARTLSYRYAPRLEALEERALLAVYTVDRLPDFGQGAGLLGDLRYCLTNAEDGDTIRFTVQGTISLRAPLPDLTHDITIEGPGPGVLTVRRATGGNYRVFTIAAGTMVSLSGLTVANGQAGSGSGGGIANAGTLTLSTSTLSGNFARVGGGIFNEGTLALTSSTLFGNVATGASPVFGGGIANTGTLTILHSTLSGNRATVSEGISSGGGLANTAVGTLTVASSTISGNLALAGKEAASAGGLAAGGTVHLRNTIVAGNTGGSQPDLVGLLASSSHNLIGNSSGGSGFQGRDVLNVNALLGPLASNGGPTLTHALLPGSPALDQGHPKSDTGGFDQRGVGFARVVGGRIDIGAFESQGGGFGDHPALVALRAVATLEGPAPLSPHAGVITASGLAVDRRPAAAQHDNLGHDLAAKAACRLDRQIESRPPEQPRIKTILQGNVEEAGDLDFRGEGKTSLGAANL